MLEFLQTGKAIYALAIVCLIGMLSKLAARSLYKRLIRETGNMMLTRNKWLRELRQRAEDTYRLNQGVANTRVFVERQIDEAKLGMFTPEGWSEFSSQMTALCFLLGGAAAFGAYWYRCDSYYIILYSSMGLLTGIFNIMLDYGVGLENKRRRLSTCLQDYLENSLWKRLGRDRQPEMEEEKQNAGLAGASAEKDPPVRLFRGRKRENSLLVGKQGAMSGTGNRGPEVTNSVRPNRDNASLRRERAPQVKEENEKVMPDEAISQLRKSLEQAAVGRADQNTKVQEKAGQKAPSDTAAGVSMGENWMKDLKPEEIKVLGEIIREYLG